MVQARVTPTWRSMLFVPASAAAFVEKAHTRQADAVILDLEDGIAKSRRAECRKALSHQVAHLVAKGVDVLVRVNHGPTDQAKDLQAAVVPGVAAIVLPKVETSAEVKRSAQAIGALESERRLQRGSVRLIAQIEHVRALPRLDTIASSSSRLLGMSLAPEDFSVSAGMEPVSEGLLWPNQMVLFACRRHGLQPLGFPGSIANFRDLRSLEEQVALARRLGFVGAFCVHPAQVPVLNSAFAPTLSELARAEAVLRAWRDGQAGGSGAIRLEGEMIDLPVVLRAKRLLSRSARPIDP